MAYTLLVRFCSQSAAAAFEDKYLNGYEQSKIVSHEGIEITLQTNDSAHTYASLISMRRNSDIDSIVVRDDDGWECEEIDLINTEGIIGLSRMIDGGESDIVPVAAAPYAPLQVSATASSLCDEEGHIIECMSDQDYPRLILASQSPRRKELLHLTGIPFTAETADVDEEALTYILKNKYDNEPFSVMAAMIVMNLARAKAQKILDTHLDAVVIGSDTIITIDSSILGKPSSSDDAMGMLRSLSGREHHVFTGVSIVSGGKSETFFSVTRVGFYPWSQKEELLARRYIDTGSPMDKAGAYGIQDMGALFIRGIKGDYYTVMGLPVSAVYNRLQNFGISMNPGKYM